MPTRLRNLTTRPVSLVLNSGTVLHLPPGHAVDTDPVEIQDNPAVDRLRRRLVLGVSGSASAATGDDADGGPGAAGASRVPSEAAGRRR